jgi:hypothetical protein
MDGAYFWSDWTPEQIAEHFVHYTPDEFLAAFDAQCATVGAPGKVTNPVKLKAAARILAVMERSSRG